MSERRIHYFAADGHFGLADGIEIIETENWTTEDFELVNETPPFDRSAFAADINNWVRLGRPEDYWTADYHVQPKYADPTLF
jgi:hypothetical protein